MRTCLRKFSFVLPVAPPRPSRFQLGLGGGCAFSPGGVGALGFLQASLSLALPSRFSVVLDAALTCRPDAQIFAREGALVFASGEAPDAAVAALAGHIPPVTVERIPARGRELDLKAVLARLTGLEVNELLVECGPRLAGGFVLANLVDEIVLYVAPSLLGADAAPLLQVSGLGPPGALPEFCFAQSSNSRAVTSSASRSGFSNRARNPQFRKMRITARLICFGATW